MPLPDYIEIPKIPIEFHAQLRMDKYLLEESPEGAEYERKKTRRKAALMIYEKLVTMPQCKITVTEREFEDTPHSVIFEIVATMEED